MTTPVRPWVWVLVAILVVFVIVRFSFIGVVLLASVNAEIQRGAATITPDEFRNVAITVRRDDGEWTSNVPIACVAVTDGVALQVYRTRAAFPDFTVITLDAEYTLVVPIGSFCDRASLSPDVPIVTDSATVPTWVAPADALGFEVSTTVVDALNGEAAVRAHYLRLRDETNWGAIMGTVDGHLVNISNRLSGKEFARIDRVDISTSASTIPPKAIEDRCLGYGTEGSDARQFRACARDVWFNLPGTAVAPDDVQQFCSTYRVTSACTGVDSSDCAPDEQRFTRGAADAFSNRLQRQWRPHEGPNGCYGVVEQALGFSVLALDGAPMFVLLEPSHLADRGRIRRYTQR
jgi:hypothetical protein